MQGITSVGAFAVLAGAMIGPAVLIIARRAMRAPVRIRQVEASAVSAAAGLLIGMVLARPPGSLAVLLPLAVLGCAAAVVDAHEGRLPDALTGPLLALTLLAGLLTADANAVILTTVISVAAGGAVALMMKATISAAFGWGDAKLVPTLAVVLVRHDAVVTGIVSVSMLVAVTAVVVGIGAPDRSTLVPYGPALVVGTVGAAIL
ncbi:prepilin peptidase [Pseudonocardia sichuanensis]|uniref:prepilin peptidase n=1 Tax=Pseudonocardia sp. MH-G8 TaxID=1854588 RepID=UPI000BA15703|nr:prepilin peptidase [Pseudonocardia sp. MH-G8]OZM79809.1 hypothetical protein CFP66_22525 [Pseudonocardia sp. MH-G8]